MRRSLIQSEEPTEHRSLVSSNTVKNTEGKQGCKETPTRYVRIEPRRAISYQRRQLLQKISNLPGLNLLEGLQLGHGHKNNHGLLATGTVNLGTENTSCDIDPHTL